MTEIIPFPQNAILLSYEHCPIAGEILFYSHKYFGYFPESFIA